MKKPYIIEDGDYIIEIPENITKQIIIDKLERYYISSLSIGLFVIGFLLGVLASS